MGEMKGSMGIQEKISRIADREEKKIRSLLNMEPQPYLTKSNDICAFCYQEKKRSEIKICQDPAGLWDDGIKACKECVEKLDLIELYNKKAIDYHGLTLAILRIRGEKA
jgi:hypothetical protein